MKARVAYMGDSITQGCGTPVNGYKHWNAVLAENYLDFAHWNLGIGYSRSEDAASQGVLMRKARQNDIVFVCYGVNDICQNRPVEAIKADLKTIVTTLKEARAKVILQTIPPFDYQGENIRRWNELNAYIKNELSACVDNVFDCVPVLCQSHEEPHNAKYGGHPNVEGCQIWAEALYRNIGDLEIDF